jgi:tight adherence protein B
MVFASIGWHTGNIKNKENRFFEDQLLDALGIIINSVRSGQSLTQAIEQVATGTKHPISTEFNEVHRQVKLGMPLNEALLAMVNRTKSKDLNIVVSSINLAKETGGSMGEILTRISATVRERKKVQGKINALTAQGKASATVISCVPFLLLIVLYVMEPAMIGLLFNTLIGNIMLLAVTGMIFIGIFFIKRIITIDI